MRSSASIACCRMAEQIGKIVAMIPAVRVETYGGMASYIASRSIWYAAIV